MTDITSYMNSESYEPFPPASMQSGMVCLGQYTEDKEWYRGLIEEVISESNALVNFVDYGNKEVISLDRISVLPEKFAKFPLQCFHCSVVSPTGSDPSWNMDQVEQFRRLVPENEEAFTVTVLDTDKEKSLHLVRLNKSGQDVDITPLLNPKIEGSGVETSVSGGLLPPSRPLELLHVEGSNLSMMAVKGSKTPSQDSGSDNGESETTDDGSEGKLLIQAPFKLNLAVQEEVLEVSVVFVESPSLIYIQRADCKAELDTLSEEIEQFCASFEDGRNFQLTFCEGDFVLAKWSEDEQWYRGEIIGVDSGSDGVLKVSFIDYGNVEVILSSSMVMCPKNFLELPAQAIPCSLAQVPHRDSWPLSYRDLIMELVEDKMMQASVVLPGSQGMKATVKLEDVESKLDVSQAVLVKLQEECEGGSSEVIAEEDEEGLEEEEETEAGVKGESKVEGGGVTLPERAIAPGSTHKVLVISCSSPHSIVCQLPSELESLEAVTNRLAELYEGAAVTTSPLLPSDVVEGMFVAAQFSEDQQWYRAQVVSCNDLPQYKVLYVDFGNSELVGLESLRPLDASLAVYPSLAVCCSLSGLETEEESSPTIADRLMELCADGECDMTVVSLDAGCCSVVLTSSQGVSLATVLNEENLASTKRDSLDAENVADAASPVKVLSDSSPEVIVEESSPEVLVEESSPEVLVDESPAVSIEKRQVEESDALEQEEEGLIPKGASISAVGQAVSPPPGPVPSGKIDIKEQVLSSAVEQMEELATTFPPDMMKSSIEASQPLSYQKNEAPDQVTAVENETPPMTDLCTPTTPTSPPTTPVTSTHSVSPHTPLNSPAPTPPPPAVSVTVIPPTPTNVTSEVDPHANTSPPPPATPPTPAPSTPTPATSPTPATLIADDAPATPATSASTSPFVTPPTTAASTPPPTTPPTLDTTTSPYVTPPTTTASTPPPASPPTTVTTAPPTADTTTPPTATPPTADTTTPPTATSPTADTTTPPTATPPTTVSTPPTATLPASDTTTPPPVTPSTADTPPVSKAFAPTPSTADSLPPSAADPNTAPSDAPPSTLPVTGSPPTTHTSDAVRVTETYLPTNLTLGSRCSVRVTMTSSPDSFTCQLTEQQEQLSELMSAIASRQYVIGVEEDFVPVPSLPVCACSSKGDVWQRGLVVSVGQVSDTYTVLFVDYGSIETLPVERIRRLEASFVSGLSPQSVQCSLPVLLASDLNPEQPSEWDDWELVWPSSCVTVFKKLVGTEDGGQFFIEPVECREDGGYVVRLFNNQLDVQKALVAKLQDPKLRVIKEAVDAADTSAAGNEICNGTDLVCDDGVVSDGNKVSFVWL